MGHHAIRLEVSKFRDQSQSVKLGYDRSARATQDAEAIMTIVAEASDLDGKLRFNYNKKQGRSALLSLQIAQLQ